MPAFVGTAIPTWMRSSPVDSLHLLSSLELHRVIISNGVFLRLAQANLKLWKLVLSNPCDDDLVKLSSLLRFLPSCPSQKNLHLSSFRLPTDPSVSDITSSIPYIQVGNFFFVLSSLGRSPSICSATAQV